MGLVPAQKSASSPSRFSAKYIIPFDHRGHTHPRIAVFHSALNTHHFAQGSDQDLRTMRYLRWERQRDVQLRAGFHVLIHNKVKTTSRDISSLALLRIQRPFRGDSDNDRQR